jgi:hypothetical protein
MVLVSTRGGTGGRDLYISRRKDLLELWPSPEPVEGVNSATYESDPWISAVGGVLFYVTDVTTPMTQGGREIWSARAASGVTFMDAAPVVELNSAVHELDPWLSGDQRTIFFARQVSVGNRELFFAGR